MVALDFLVPKVAAMEIPLLNDVIVILGLSFLVILISNRLRVPAIIGFLITGMIFGPHLVGLIRNVHEVQLLAEIGVVLLLFTIGMEFSLESFLSIKRTVLLGGSAQVGVMVAAGAVAAYFSGMSVNQSVFVGFILALSSTAIVLKLLDQRAEIGTPHGRTSLGVLIFQDIVVVPMILLTPLLAGKSEHFGMALAISLGKGVGVIGLTIFLARWLVPRVLFQAARLRDQEVFLIAVALIGFGVAWLTHQVGLSAALGAFLAGLIVSESEYSHRALGAIIPFRDLFTSLFFVSVGMLLNVATIIDAPLVIPAIALAVIAVKICAGCAAAMILGAPLRTSVLVGFALCQVGEFSFILSQSGVEAGLLDEESYQMFLAVSIISMMATPFILMASPGISGLLSRIPLPKRLLDGYGQAEGEDGPEALEDHIIIVGFGANGQNLARAAGVSEAPFVIIEMNPDTVRKKRAEGLPIFYGDASREAVLEHAGVASARVMVVAITDAAAVRRTVEVARRLNPRLHIIARTLFITEMEPLLNLGADEVIPQEFETSVEIFTRVLAKYMIPWEEIQAFTDEVRADGYQLFRNVEKQGATVCDVAPFMQGLEINSFRVQPGSAAVGKSALELELRKNHDVTLLAIRRGENVIAHPARDQKLETGDVVVLFGTLDRMTAAAALFEAA